MGKIGLVSVFVVVMGVIEGKTKAVINIADVALILAGQLLIVSLIAAALYWKLKKKLEQRLNFVVAQLRKKPRRLEMQIFVNTLHKVGSTSICQVLRAALPDATIEKSHCISYESQLAVAQDLHGMGNGPLKESLVKMIPRMMAIRQDLDGVLAPGSQGGSAYFISGTREPLSWALSTLFQHIWAGHLPAEYGEPVNVQRIIMDWFSGQPVLHWLFPPREWMAHEIESYLGVNVMREGFDHKQGYQVMETKRGRLLVVRQENLDCLPQALGELLSVPADLFKMVRVNVAAEKTIGRHYQELGRTLRFPKSFVERVYADPYAVTFYSPEERRKFVAQWSE